MVSKNAKQILTHKSTTTVPHAVVILQFDTCHMKNFNNLLVGVQLGRPDLVPRTPPPAENLADCEANLSTSSLGSTGLVSTSPPLQ